MSNAHFGSGRYKTTQHFMLLTHCCLKRALPKPQIVSLFSVPPVTRFDTSPTPTPPLHNTMAAALHIVLLLLLLNPQDPIRGEAGGVKRPAL